MAEIRGFNCGKSKFWSLIRNPVYCGVVVVPATKNEAEQFVKGAHEPIIHENFFYDVQQVLKIRPREKSRNESVKKLFPLRGFLTCPYCARKMTGSISKGSNAKYRYYHCTTSKCKGRFRGDKLDSAYENQLGQVRLKPQVYELFELVLEEENIFSHRKAYLNDRSIILSEISVQQTLMSKARRFLLSDKIDIEDFTILKKEYHDTSGYLYDQLNEINAKLAQSAQYVDSHLPTYGNICHSYRNQDIEGKRSIISFIKPSAIDQFAVGPKSLKVSESLELIIEYNKS